jgi:hypothetical protein
MKDNNVKDVFAELENELPPIVFRKKYQIV